MSSVVDNQRLKLRATFVSNLGIAAFIACFNGGVFCVCPGARLDPLLNHRSGLVQSVIDVWSSRSIRCTWSL